MRVTPLLRGFEAIAIMLLSHPLRKSHSALPSSDRKARLVNNNKKRFNKTLKTITNNSKSMCFHEDRHTNGYIVYWGLKDTLRANLITRY